MCGGNSCVSAFNCVAIQFLKTNSAAGYIYCDKAAEKPTISSSFSGDITQKGYEKKRAKLLQPFLKKHEGM